jgi:hypothetical protein
MRREGTGLFAVLALLCPVASTPARAQRGLVQGRVVGVAPSRDAPVSVDMETTAGVAVGDAAAIVDGATPVASGYVAGVSGSHADVRLTQRYAEVEADAACVVATASAVANGKTGMPTGTTVRGHVVRVGPGRRQAWINVGRASGLERGDTLWVRRGGFPIARAEVLTTEGNGSLVQCWHLVTNTLPTIGDAVALWPSPAARRNARPETIVMDVTPSSDGVTLTLAGSARDGFSVEQQIDLFDGSRYAGQAGVTATSDRLVLAESLPAFATTQPAVGMRAVARPPAERRAARLEARIFEIRGSYVLISAGQADGVRVGQRFAVIRDGKRLATLEVRAVKVDFAGAEIVAGAKGDAKGAALRKWDRVARLPLPPPTVIEVGTTATEVGPEGWLLATLTTDEPIRIGAVVRVGDERATAALVVRAAGPTVLLYVPPGWAGGPVPVGADVSLVRDEG